MIGIILLRNEKDDYESSKWNKGCDYWLGFLLTYILNIKNVNKEMIQTNTTDSFS